MEEKDTKIQVDQLLPATKYDCQKLLDHLDTVPMDRRDSSSKSNSWKYAGNQKRVKIGIILGTLAVFGLAFFVPIYFARRDLDSYDYGG